MTTLFIIGGLGVIIANIQNVPSVFVAIFHDAFTGTAAVGGFTGAGISLVMRSGVARSINSNEAGQGSSPFIHGSANTIHPIRQGLWGSFEVFADTVIVCSITALAILCAGEWVTGQAGATLTIISYESVYGRFGSVFIGIMCGLFGITTTAGWYTYYVAVINHALRYKPIARDKVLKIFKFVFPLPNIIIVSSIVLTGNGPELFWTIVDITLVVPVFTNLLALVVLRKKFWELLKDYKARHMGIGTVDPNFNVFYEDDPKIAEEEEKIREKMRLISKKAYNKA
jgi:AGCS family alanine or glycine:cation symporter